MDSKVETALTPLEQLVQALSSLVSLELASISLSKELSALSLAFPVPTWGTSAALIGKLHCLPVHIRAVRQQLTTLGQSLASKSPPSGPNFGFPEVDGGQR